MKELAKGYFDIDMCVYVCDFAFLFTTFGYYYCLCVFDLGIGHHYQSLISAVF